MNNKEIIENNRCLLRESILNRLAKRDYANLLIEKNFTTTRVDAFLERCGTFYQ